jgi:ABC-type multidrug transport system fused ATPase/permease subunit
MERAIHSVAGRSATATFAEGLDHPVDARGSELTGAQRQILALAGAWLADGDILILDEPTSCLDGPTEEHVLRALRMLAERGRTIVVATRREAVANRSDLVLAVQVDGTADFGSIEEVLAGGVAELGLWPTNEELLLPDNTTRRKRASNGKRPLYAGTGNGRRRRS